MYADIKKRILQGELKPGDQLPTEAELEKLYSASRAPVRQALTMLEQETFLLRCQGRGTFVCDRKKESHRLLQSGFSKDMERDFNQLSSKTLWIKMEKPDDDVREILMLDEDQQVIHIHRLRYFKDIPIFSMHNYVRDSLNIETFKRAGDFFIISEVLERDFQITLYRAEEDIRAAAADDKMAEEMQIPVGFPLLSGKRVYYTENDRSVYMSLYHVRTDYWSHKTTYYANNQ
nr:GntR family transcriptional regulator [Cloacibacillus porcorum]